MECLLQVLPLTFTPFFSFSLTGGKEKVRFVRLSVSTWTYTGLLSWVAEKIAIQKTCSLGRDGFEGKRKSTMPSFHNPENIY